MGMCRPLVRLGKKPFHERQDGFAMAENGKKIIGIFCNIAKIRTSISMLQKLPTFLNVAKKTVICPKIALGAHATKILQ